MPPTNKVSCFEALDMSAKEIFGSPYIYLNSEKMGNLLRRWARLFEDHAGEKLTLQETIEILKSY